MIIYLVTEDDADPYCGYYVKSAWSTEKLATEEIKKLENLHKYSEYKIQELEIDSTDE